MKIRSVGWPLLLSLFVLFTVVFGSMRSSPARSEQDQNVSLSEMDAGLRALESAFQQSQRPEDKAQLIEAYRAMSERLVREDKLNEALMYLEWIDQLTAADAAVQPGSAKGYLELGMASLAKDDLYLAKKHFDEAVGRDAGRDLAKGIAVALHNAGVKKLDLKNTVEAEKYFTLSVQYYDQIQNTWETLGDIAYNTQRLREARQYWEKAFKIKSTRAVKTKLAKLERESSVESDLAQYGSEHFIIRYKRDDKTFQGYQLKQVLNEAYRVISRDFNHYPDITIPVILYDDAEYRQVMNTPHWSGGMYDGKIRLPVYEEGRMNVKEFTRVVYHELTHAFVADLSGRTCPAWLNEGLAVFEEDRVQPVNTQILDKEMKTGRAFSYVEMTGALQKLKDVEQVGLFYAQAYAMTKFLITRYRMYRMVEMLRFMKDNRSFEDALKKSTGLSIKQFEDKWPASVR